jgi:hypothetical protein
MPIQRVVHIKASRATIRKAFAQLPIIASGHTQTVAACQVMQVRMGLALLFYIWDAFAFKARGGTDAAGDRWAPLSPVTIRKRRKGPGNRFGTDILRDTGLLFNSLSPSIQGTAAAPPHQPHQIFNIPPGQVVIGTNRKWCHTHHYGVPGHIPQRRLWPEVRRWPKNWWDAILSEAQQGMIDILLYLLGHP